MQGGLCENSAAVKGNRAQSVSLWLLLESGYDENVQNYNFSLETTATERRRRRDEYCCYF